MDKTIIWATSGAGKSRFLKSLGENPRVFDCDNKLLTSAGNFENEMESMFADYDTVLLPCALSDAISIWRHDRLLDYNMFLCYPSTSCMSEYMQRYINRDFDDGVLQEYLSNPKRCSIKTQDQIWNFLLKKRADFVKGFRAFDDLNLTKVKKIRMQPRQVLADVMPQNRNHPPRRINL